MNNLDVDAILENENDSCVGMILVNGKDLGVDGNWIGWIPPPHIDFPHYHPSFLGYPDPFSGPYLLPPIPNLSPIYATSPPSNLSPRIVHAPRRLILFGVFDMTLLQGQTVPLPAHASGLHVFYVFVPAIWIPEKTP